MSNRPVCSRLPHSRRSILRAVVLLLAPFALGGCALTPEGAGGVQVPNRLYVDFTVAGRINPAYYYFIAIDTDGDASDGPVPVVSSPWGNGWGTGSITHFLQYHQGVFTLYRFRPDSNLLLADPIGPPFESNVPETPPGSRIHAVLDMDLLGDNVQEVNLNLITTDRIDIEPTFQSTKMYDGLGASGNNYLTFSTDVSQTYSNALSPDPEEANDLPPQPDPDVEAADLDITDWSVEVRRL